MIRQVYDHNYKPNTLVVEIDAKMLNKMFNFKEGTDIIILKKSK
jgi:hypothetical protein